MKKIIFALFLVLIGFSCLSAQNCDDDDDDDYDIFSGFLYFFGLGSSEEDCLENVTSKFKQYNILTISSNFWILSHTILFLIVTCKNCTVNVNNINSQTTQAPSVAQGGPDVGESGVGVPGVAESGVGVPGVAESGVGVPGVGGPSAEESERLRVSVVSTTGTTKQTKNTKNIFTTTKPNINTTTT